MNNGALVRLKHLVEHDKGMTDQAHGKGETSRV